MVDIEMSTQQLFQQLTQDREQLQKTLELLQRKMDGLVEENNRLRIKNSQLENLVDYLARDTPPDIETSTETSEVQSPFSANLMEDTQARLKKFYDEGIHICHDYYGSKREIGAECMFCHAVLYGAREAH